jgi:hypothetical protein
VKKHLITACAAMIVGLGIGSAGVAFASTPKASGYCTKAEVGKTGHYTTKTQGTKTVKCTKVPTYKYTWKTVK